MATSDDPRIKFGLSCPEGGDFHICQRSSTRFIGCCDVDPCTPEANGNCPLPNLFNASFSAVSGVVLLPQSCSAPFNSSFWFTCTDARPPFLGCCKNNPCNNGCKAGNLVPAMLSEDPNDANQFLLPITTTSSSSSSNSSPSPTATAVSGARGHQGSSNARVGIIVGTTLAGVLVLLLVITAYLWIKRKEKSRLDTKDERGLGLDPGATAGTEQSERFFQGPMFTTPPITHLTTPPAGKSTFPAVHSNRSSHELEANSLSPLASEHFYNPRVSQLSELEGSGIPKSPRPNLADECHSINELES
ncbi:hypothetical protein F5Y10DRAFT_260353 [Nemania abortiva]|nr:hypothetical protein F5Y10DRAFT_260353 [Nemania abortiva]